MEIQSDKANHPSSPVASSGGEITIRDHSAGERHAKQAATVKILKQVAQGGEHELVVAISARDAIEELVPLLDRLLAVGEVACAQDTEEGWQEAARRLLNASVLIRVVELRHAVGVAMDYAPSDAGAKVEVLQWLAALQGLRTRLQRPNLAPVSRAPSDGASSSTTPL